jgi:hypothetical protein
MREMTYSNPLGALDHIVIASLSITACAFAKSEISSPEAVPIWYGLSLAECNPVLNDGVPNEELEDIKGSAPDGVWFEPLESNVSPSMKNEDCPMRE